MSGLHFIVQDRAARSDANSVVFGMWPGKHCSYLCCCWWTERKLADDSLIWQEFAIHIKWRPPLPSSLLLHLENGWLGNVILATVCRFWEIYETARQYQCWLQNSIHQEDWWIMEFRFYTRAKHSHSAQKSSTVKNSKADEMKYTSHFYAPKCI